MATQLQTPASPLDDGPRPEPEFIAGPAQELDTPASPPQIPDLEADLSESHARFSFREISPPASKRPRFDSSVEENLRSKIDLPNSHVSGIAKRGVQNSAGSSSSTARRIVPAAPRPAGSNMASRHYASHTPFSLSDSSRSLKTATTLQRHNSGPAIPTAPKATHQLSGSEHLDKVLSAIASRAGRPSSVPQSIGTTFASRPPALPIGSSIHSYPPSLIGRPPVDDQASKKSASEVSSIDPPPETCVNCRFPLSNKSTLRCHDCRRNFHVTCKMDSKLVDGKWKCARCLKRDAKRAAPSTTKAAQKPESSVPKKLGSDASKTSRSSTPFGLSADRYSYHGRVQQKTAEAVKIAEKYDLPVPYRSRSSTPLGHPLSGLSAIMEDGKQSSEKTSIPPPSNATIARHSSHPSSSDRNQSGIPKQVPARTQTFSTGEKLIPYGSSSRPSSRGKDAATDPQSNQDSVPVPSVEQPVEITVAQVKPGDPTFLRDAGLKPKGNAFAHGIQLQSKEAETSTRDRTRVHETREETETEASMEISDVDFSETDLITSTPMPKAKTRGNVTEEIFTWSQHEYGTEVPPPTRIPAPTEAEASRTAPLAMELPVPPGVDSAVKTSSSAGAAAVAATSNTIEVPPSASMSQPPETMFSSAAAGDIDSQASSEKDMPQSTAEQNAEVSRLIMLNPTPNGLPSTTGLRVVTNAAQPEDGNAASSPLRLDTSASALTPRPLGLSTPTAASPGNIDSKPRLDYLSKFKIKKRTSLDHSPVEAIKSPAQHIKPSGVPGWSRAFQQAGCEDPFKDAGSPSVKLNYCEDIYNLFGKCPWDLVSRDLRPKRFKLELLKALAGLKNVLDRFDSVNECLERLETFIVERRMSCRASDLGVPKLTTGDVTAFIEIMAALAVKCVAKQNATDRSETPWLNALDRPLETVEQTAGAQKNEIVPEAVNGDKVQDTTTSLSTVPALKDVQDLIDRDPEAEKAPTPAPAKVSSPANQPESRKAARKSAHNQRKLVPFPSMVTDLSTAEEAPTPSVARLPRTEPRMPNAPARPLNASSPVQADDDDDPSKTPHGFKRYVRRTFAHLLAGTDNEAPLPVSEVATLALSLAPMEQYTDAQLAAQPPRVQALVAELRSMTPLRQEAMLLAQSRNPFTAVQGRASLRNIDDECIQKAVRWAVEKIREEQRAKKVATQRQIPQPEAEVEQADVQKDGMSGTTTRLDGLASVTQPENELCTDDSIEQSEVDLVLGDQSISPPDEPSNSLASRRVSFAYVEDVSDEEDNGVIDSLLPEHDGILEEAVDGADHSVLAAAGASKQNYDKHVEPEPTTAAGLEKEQPTASVQLLSELPASTSRAQSAQSDDVSQMSESASDLTELENTPEPPSHLFQTDRSRGAPRLKLRFSAHENAARTVDKDAQTTNSGKPSRGFTQFSFRELILLALYEEPQRLYGRKALLPRLTSKSVVHFVLDKFPSYSDPAHQVQRDHLFNNIAAQCSTHVARGILGKEAGTLPETGKPATFYYADTSSTKWPRPDALHDLSTRYRQHLAETFPSAMEDDQTKQATPSKKRPLSVPETPSPKKLKLTTRPSGEAEPESEQSDHEVRHGLNSAIRAPRKALRVSSGGKPRDTDKTPRILQSASRMKATDRANVESSASNAATSSSSDRTIPDSVLEPELSSTVAPAARVPEKDEPQANIADPLDALLESLRTPSADEQELLDLLSTMCDKEAARDVSKMAEKKYEVVDFFEHWPQHHPSNILAFDTEAKMQEIKKRPNRRQIMGRPCKTATPIRVYRPYGGLSAPLFPGSEPASATASFGSGTVLRNASPNKQRNNISPRKRRAMRMDDSNIYADEIDDTMLEQAASMGGHVKEARSWQEALGMPRMLEIGFLEDPLGKRDKRLVLEVPAAERGKTRNWFKAILPGD